MGYDIRLVDPVSKETLELENAHFMRGGTYCNGGTNLAELSVTYNYAPFFRKVFGDENVKLSDWDKLFGGAETGIRRLYGMGGADSIPILEKAISELADDVTDSYWDGTEGNAKRALIQLLTLAKMRPDGVWDGD